MPEEPRFKSRPCCPTNHLTLVPPIGKGMKSFHLCLATQEWALGLGHILPKRHGVFTACAGFMASCGNVSLWSRFNVSVFVPPKCVRHVAAGQSHCCISSQLGGNGVFCLLHERGACRSHPCVGCGTRPMPTAEVDPDLSLHMSKASFPPVPV